MSDKEKEVKNTEEMSTEFVEQKKKKREGKSVFSRIMNIVLWVILLGWMAICLTDFYNVSKEKVIKSLQNKKIKLETLLHVSDERGEMK